MILNTSFTPLVGGSNSVFIGQESGCEVSLQCLLGSSCSYRNFSLFCTPCVVDSYLSMVVRVLHAHMVSMPGKISAVVLMIKLAIDCAGEWSACRATAARSGRRRQHQDTGAACPVGRYTRWEEHPELCWRMVYVLERRRRSGRRRQHQGHWRSMSSRPRCAAGEDCPQDWLENGLRARATAAVDATAAPSGTGAACPVEPRCAMEDDCPQDCAGE